MTPNRPHHRHPRRAYTDRCSRLYTSKLNPRHARDAWPLWRTTQIDVDAVLLDIDYLLPGTSQFIVPEVIFISPPISGGIPALVVVIKTGHDRVGDLLDLFPARPKLVRFGIRVAVEPIQRFVDGELKLLAARTGYISSNRCGKWG